MEESGGDKGDGRKEISLLTEELVQLSIQKSTMVPSAKPTLMCSIWTKEYFNPDSLKAQLKSIFTEGVVELIFRIPLALEPHEDILAWSGESSGEFSVRSAYKLLQNRGPTAYALQNNYKAFYRKLWQLDLPSKIKILIWKIFWNYLPTRVNLSTRNLSNTIVCPRCNGNSETLIHIFRKCLEIWEDLSDPAFLLFSNEDLLEWLTGVFASVSWERSRLFCGVLWAVWGDRNSRIHEKKGKSSQEIIHFVRGYLKELDGVKKADRRLPVVEAMWVPPPGQTIKINFDGAFDEGGKQAASGIVARDEMGRVLISDVDIHEGVRSAFEAEAIACRRAVQIALAMNREATIIKGDSLTIIKKCNTEEFDKSVIGPYIHDIKKISRKVKKLRLIYIPRSRNQLAHVLAKESLRMREKSYLVDEVPRYARERMRVESIREPD